MRKTLYTLANFGTPAKDGLHETWLAELTPEAAEACAARAKLAGCEPAPTSPLAHGVPMMWSGPDVTEVIANLRRAEGRPATS